MAVTGPSNVVVTTQPSGVATKTGPSNVVVSTQPTAGVTALTGRSNVVVSAQPDSVLYRRTPTGSKKVYLFRRTPNGSIPVAAGLFVPPPVLGTLAVTNFLPLAPTTTGAAFTFQTTPGVPVTRVMEDRPVGSSTWRTHSVVTRNPDGAGVVSHTAGFTGETPDTDYERRMTFSAVGFTSLTITAATLGLASLNSRTAATTAPVSSEPRLTWAPPVLDDPIVWRVGSTARSINVPSDRDLRIVMPSTPFSVRGGLEVVGGRNIVLIGGEYRVDTPWYLASQNTDGVRREAAGTNRFIKFRGRANTTPRTIHFEGLKIHGSELFEGMNWQAYGDTRVTIVRQNIWWGKIRAFVPNPVNGGSHDGGDAWQPIEDPYIDRADREWLSDLEYQGYFLQPTQFGPAGRTLGTWDYRRVQFIGGDTPKQLLAMNGAEPPVSRRLTTDVWVQPNTAQGQTSSQAIKGEWNGLNIGTSPTRFVDPDKVGAGYVSTGYL